MHNDTPLRWPDGRKPRDWSGIGCGVFITSLVSAVVLCACGWHWWSLGLVGIGIVAISSLHHLSHEPYLRSLDTQLLSRSRFNAMAWSGAHRAAKAEAVAKVFASVLCWPNHYLLPDDPLALLWFRPMPDGGEGLEVAIMLQRQFVFGPQRLDFETFGELVDSLKELDSAPLDRV